MLPEIAKQLAPTGVLRAAINMSNYLLVSGRSANGNPEGVAPDMARGIAEKIGVPVQYVPFPNPGALADAAGTGAWDIGLIGAEPQRAEKIAFSPAYVEIDSTYLVQSGSSLRTIADVDAPGVRIASMARSAYDLWLERNIRHATLVLGGRFMAVQQAIGTAPGNDAGIAFIREFVESAKGSGRVAALIDKHKVRGLSVAPKA
jgi:polar amino acid transport system substrate-binding protein